MKYKIGIFGASSSMLAEIKPKAEALGKAIGKNPDDWIVITGACSGIPYMVAEQAHRSGAEIWGYSPARNLDEHKAMMPDDDYAIYSKLIFLPPNVDGADSKRVRMKFRNVTSTSNCDAGVIISGRWGSLNEFTNLVDMQKVVGVMTGTGMIVDILPQLTKQISKDGQGPVVFDDDPAQLLEKITAELSKR